jgi:hypothetical protein
MSDGAFEPEKYQDDHRLRVLARIDEKVKGREITAAPQPVAKPGPVIDLMEALRESMKKPPRRKPLQLHGRGERKPNTSAFSLSFTTVVNVDKNGVGVLATLRILASISRSTTVFVLPGSLG